MTFLPQFAGTNVIKPTAGQRAELLAIVAEGYPAGRSLRELAELTGRTQAAVRRALDKVGIPRRGRQRLSAASNGSPNPHAPGTPTMIILSSLISVTVMRAPVQPKG